MFGTFKYALREASRRPLWFLARRLGDELLKLQRSFRAFLGGNPYTARALGQDSTRLGEIVDREAVGIVLDLLREQGSSEVKLLLERADRVANHEFEIFQNSYRLGDTIEWNCDFKSGYRWPARFHARYSYKEIIDLERATDIKLPWEIGRLQYLPVLALAYRVSGERRHAAAAREIFESWACANPVGYGIQWVTGMDVALRAISLILTAELLHGTPEVNNLVDERYLQVLGEHGRFLYRNVEYSDVNGNHHTSCLLGLLYLGVWLKGAREACAWRSRAVRGLQREILLEVYPDGVCHEGSIPYHRLVTEIFLHAYFLSLRCGIELGEDYRQRLGRMLDFVVAYTKPSGQAPVWGDADDGRVHALGSQGVNDHRYLLTLGSLMLDRSELWPHSAGLCMDGVVLLSAGMLRTARSLARPERNELRLESTAFSSGGFFVLREGRDWCLVDCGDVGLRGRGGHGHNDALSIEVALDGMDILTDTGSAAYTRSVSERVASLCAAAHNVAVVDGHEPAELSVSGERIPHATTCPVEVVRWAPQEGVFIGRHRGYCSHEGIGIYERRLELKKGRPSLTIADHIAGKGEHRVEWHFHFAERWRPVVGESPSVYLFDEDGVMKATLECNLPEAEITIGSEGYYPSYGHRQERRYLVVSVTTSLPVQTSFSLIVLQDHGNSSEPR